MSKAQETLIVQLDRMGTELAFRKAAMYLGTIRELEEGHFQIKETDNGYSAGTVTMGSFGAGFSTDKTNNPVTVDVYINSKTEQQTEVTIVASCFGGGPIQNNHCKSKLSTVKSAIMVSISEAPKQNVQQVNTVEKAEIEEQTVEQPTTSSPLITVVKTEESGTNKFNVFKILTFIFAGLSALLYAIVSVFWNHIACFILILLFSAVSFAFSVIVLRKDRDWLIQIIAPAMLLLVAIAFRIVIF